jgi:hypothetical protein
VTPLLPRTLVRPNASVGPLRADVPAPAWTIPTLPGDDPGREACRLLGSAWRSPTPRLVPTGGDFDAVRVPQPYAAPALEQLRRRGAVLAERDLWTFFVPPRSHRLPWPPWATYVSGLTVRIPPRASRSDGLRLWWVTRGEPVGRLLTEPFVLCPILAALAPSGPGPARGITLSKETP